MSVVVVWVEEVAMGTVFLPFFVPDDLDVLAELVRQARQIVSSLLQRPAHSRTREPELELRQSRSWMREWCCGTVSGMIHRAP